MENIRRNILYSVVTLMEQVKRKLVIIIGIYYVRKYLFPILKWLWLLKYLNFLELNIFIYTLYIFSLMTHHLLVVLNLTLSGKYIFFFSKLIVEEIIK